MNTKPLAIVFFIHSQMPPTSQSILMSLTWYNSPWAAGPSQNYFHGGSSVRLQTVANSHLGTCFPPKDRDPNLSEPCTCPPYLLKCHRYKYTISTFWVEALHFSSRVCMGGKNGDGCWARSGIGRGRHRERKSVSESENWTAVQPLPLRRCTWPWLSHWTLWTFVPSSL